MKKLNRLILITGVSIFTLLGTTALSAKCGDAPKVMKSASGKCGAAMKKDANEKLQDTNVSKVKEEAKKVAPKSVKCGVGKCG